MSRVIPILMDRVIPILMSRVIPILMDRVIPILMDRVIPILMGTLQSSNSTQLIKYFLSQKFALKLPDPLLGAALKVWLQASKTSWHALVAVGWHHGNHERG